MSNNEDQSNQQNTQENTQDTGGTTGDNSIQGLNELDLLKSRAKMMGIVFSNNIGLEALKAKVQAKMDGNEQVEEDKLEDENTVTGNVSADIQPNALEMGMRGDQAQVEARPETLREKLYREEMALVRCRITNLDPKKKDLPGEIICIANEYLGTVRKFVPFGEHTDDGYHIPVCIYNMLKNRKFLNIRTARDPRTRTERVTSNWAPEFAIEVLDPLTTEELKQLAQAQLAAGSLDAALA